MGNKFLKSTLAKLVAATMIFSVFEGVIPTNIGVVKKEIVMAAETVTVPGGRVSIETKEASKAEEAVGVAFGDKASAEFDQGNKTLTVTLNSDVLLERAIVFAGDSEESKIHLNLNNHSITGAPGKITKIQNKALGSNAIEVEGQFVFEIEGEGTVTGGKGGTYLGHDNGLANEGCGGGCAIFLTGQAMYADSEDEIYTTDELKYGIVVSGNAKLVGGKGGDVTYAQWLENVLTAKDNFVNSDKLMDARGGNGGDGIGAGDGVIEFPSYGPLYISFGYVKLNSGTIRGGEGGDCVIGENSTSMADLIKTDEIKAYSARYIFYMSNITFSGGIGGNGIETHTGRRYIYSANNTLIAGGDGGKVTSSEASMRSNRVVRKQGNGGAGIAIGGDIGLTDEYLDEDVTAAKIRSADSKITGIRIEGAVKGGNSPDATSRIGFSTVGGHGITTVAAFKGSILNCESTNLGAIYIADTGVVSGGNDGNVDWGAAGDYDVNWGYGLGISIRGTQYYTKTYGAPNVFVVDGKIKGGNGGNSRCGCARENGSLNAPTNYNNGCWLAEVTCTTGADEGLFSEGKPAIHFDDSVYGNTCMGHGSLECGDTGYTYCGLGKTLSTAEKNERYDISAVHLDTNSYDYDDTKAKIMENFQGTVTDSSYTLKDKMKSVTESGTAKVTAIDEAKAKTGNRFKCTVSGTTGSGTPIYDWRYSNGTVYANRTETVFFEPDLQGDGTNTVTIEKDISVNMNAAIAGKNTVKVYCYVIYPNGVTIKSNELSLAAGETVKKCKVTFDANGGTCTNSAYTTENLEPGQSYYLYNLYRYFIKSDYELVGWNTKKDGSGENYNNFGNAPYKESDYTLYAQWKGKEYGIHFDSNGGDELDEDVANITVYHGDKFGRMPVPTNPDTSKGFIGWFSKSSGGIQIKETDIVDDTLLDNTVFEETNWDYIGSTVFYAHWGARYEINYELNGGTNNEENPEYYTGDKDVELKDPTKEGYKFDGWYANAQFTGTRVTKIAAGATGDVTLYAKWNPIKYSIVFDGNGATGGVTAGLSDVAYDRDVTLTKNGFSRTGYSFLKWNTKRDGSGDSFENQATVANLSKVEGDVVTLYACWRANEYTLTFDANGGTLNPEESTKTITYDQPFGEMPQPTPPKDSGLDFAGWYTKPENGEGDLISEGTIVTQLDDFTVYAHWSIKHKITYVLGEGATNHPENLDYYYESDAFILREPTKEGYVFGGWFEESDFTGTPITEIAKGSTKDYTLYAKWTVVKYKISFDVNGTGFSGTMSSISCEYDKSYTLPKVSFKKTGYSFVKWNTMADGTGDSYENGQTVKNISKTDGENVILYAQWAKIKYYITYHLNGGKNNAKNKSYYYITTATFSFSKPTKTGYTFVGWYKDKKFKKKITQIKKGSHAKVDVYAKWKVNTYNIKFNGNGAKKGKMSIKKNCKYGKKYTLGANKFKRSGYVFLGWATSKTNANNQLVAYKNKAAVKNLSAKNKSTVTLYAVWKKK